MSAKHEWLNLLEVSGPFLAVPVLREAFPQGLEELEGSRAKRLRSAYEEWRDAVDGGDADLERLHVAWINEVLRTALDADGHMLKGNRAVPSATVVELPEHDITIAPDLVIVDPTHDDAVLAPFHVFGPDTDLSASMKFGGLSCSPGDRMALHLRALNKPLGLVTNGECWMLVHALQGQVATFASWYARMWGLEPQTLCAFASLLGVRRFFGPERDRLPALFERSLKHQDEVTDALGDQVRRAIEVLVQALDRADQDRNRELLRDVQPQELYEAGLTVMMRLVFLLAAEERGLLLLGEPRYDSFYAVSTLRMQLRVENEEILERRRAAWSRLLALFRAVFGGIDHPTMRLLAMGGSLFDPDRFPFLEGRLKGTSWRQDRSEPLPIDDRTVLLLLDAIQTFEGHTLSYRALDVEQVGHVYEGLLERTVTRVEDVTLELEAGAQAQDARVTLGELESASLVGRAAVTGLIVERSRRSELAIKNALTAEIEPQQSARLLSTCRGDVKLRDRLEPYARLLRTDPWGYPLVHPKGAFVVVLGTDRRETGTHYTPKSLTERIVEETLTPLVYDGPARGAPRAEWKLKTPGQLLDLKCCDIAMGSGAFLVQVCRFLSARLVEAWSMEEEAGRVVDLTGQVHEPPTSVESMPPGLEARAENARRIVAERCLYGVDLNPLAVELAKLSLWLVTLSKGRPFGFLDHNLRRGDSLLGINRLEQLTELTLHASDARQGRLFGKAIERAVVEAVELRRKLSEIPVRDIQDVAAMATLDGDARKKLEVAELLADALIGAVFANKGADLIETRLAALAVEADQIVQGDAGASGALSREAKMELSKDSAGGRPRRPFHWPLEFPDVFCGDAPGFDAIVGNPPFLGGKRITGIAGDAYRDWLIAHVADGRRGSADLAAYFFLRAWSLLREGGCFGLLAVNTIAEGDTRQVGLEAMLRAGAVIYTAYPNEPWPGKAAVVTSRVHVYRGAWLGVRSLSGSPVDFISAYLSEHEEWSPKRLKSNERVAFQGSVVVGMGFVLTHAEARELIEADPKNAEVVFAYLSGDDINSQPDQRPSRSIICFWDWPEERARKYKEPWRWIDERVRPERQRRNESGQFVLRKPLPQRWWHYGDKRPGLYHGIGRGERFEKHPKDWVSHKPLDKLFACSLHSKHLGIAVVPSDWVYAHGCAVFATESMAAFALLTSSINDVWSRKNSSSLGETLRYVITDAFETLPLCSLKHPELDEVGARYQQHRAELGDTRRIGLTDIYNRFHAPADTDPDLERLRDLHRQIDFAVARAYGWADLELGHGFHPVPYLPENDRVRFTISETARLEVLRRLGELNRQRYIEEQTSLVHARKITATRDRAKTPPAEQGAFALVETPAPKPTASKTKISTSTRKASARRTSR